MDKKMLTNEEIIAKLSTILDKTNLCDQIEELKIFEPEYKNSAFYKVTHKKIEELFFLYKIQSLLTFDSLLKNLQSMINGIDADSFNKMLDEANAKTNGDIKNYEKEFKDSGILDLLKNSKK